MAQIDGPIKEGPIGIRPADPSVFKKAPGERKYNAIVKSQSTAQQILESGQRFTEEQIKIIGDCLNFVDNNIQNPIVLDYLTTIYGEGANQVLQQMIDLQDQLRQQYNSIIKSPDQPKQFEPRQFEPRQPA